MIVLVYGEIKKNGRGETHISKVSQPAAGPRIWAAQRPKILVIYNSKGQNQRKKIFVFRHSVSNTLPAYILNKIQIHCIIDYLINKL